MLLGIQSFARLPVVFPYINSDQCFPDTIEYLCAFLMMMVMITTHATTRFPTIKLPYLENATLTAQERTLNIPQYPRRHSQSPIP